jgi:hypothetical protein
VLHLLMHGMHFCVSKIPLVLPCFSFVSQMGQAYFLLSTWHKATLKFFPKVKRLVLVFKV